MRSHNVIIAKYQEEGKQGSKSDLLRTAFNQMKRQKARGVEKDELLIDCNFFLKTERNTASLVVSLLIY